MPLKISSPILDAGPRFANLLAGCFEGVVVETALDDCQANIDRDGVMLDRLLKSGNCGPLIRIWQNRNCLVVPRSLKSDRNFVRAEANCPLPVANRISGGTAVIHGPHIVNVSIAAQITNHSMPGFYSPITDLILPALLSLGLKAVIGPVNGAHCDGRFNICIRHRKVGGTAAFVRSHGGLTATLAHASITVEPCNQDLHIIERFEHDLDRAKSYRNDAHTSICAEMWGSSR